jgi:pimeloyl-ACP methyl ester carboxylesterase
MRTRALAVLSLAVILPLLASCSDDEPGAEPATGATGATAPADDVDSTEPRIVTYDGAPTDAPDEYDRIRVVEVGDPDAENVLVLSPGTSAGAGYFLPLARDLVDALPDWQVWSVDRRENLLEDHSQLRARRAGEIDNQEAWNHYIGWIGDDTITEHFEAPSDEDVAFAREWGMAVAVDDLHVVIDEASERGGKVVLGGHSLGGNVTVAYATWDFDGTPGAADLDGIALIDGGSGPASDVSEVQSELDELAEGSPFNDLLGLGLPWAPGVFNALGANSVLLDPDGASIAYDSPLLPANLKPPVRPTNAGQYGYALDVDSSPENLALVHLSMGSLAEEGDPRGWVDDGRVPIERTATMFAGIEDIDGTAWYHPVRLTIDGGTTNGGLPDPSQELVGVRSTRVEDLELPIFALETGFGAGRVIPGAELLAERAGIGDDRLTLVEAHDITHTDPMAIEPDNPLVDALVPFLRDAA